MSIHTDPSLPSSAFEATSSTPPSVGKDAAGRQVTHSSQAKSGIPQQKPGSSLADRIRMQDQRVAKQEAKSTIGELNKNSQAEHTDKYEQASNKYYKKSTLGKWASRVAGHFTETAYTQKKDTLTKLQADIEGYMFKFSSSKQPQDLAEDKATLRQWQGAIANYSPKDRAKLMSSVTEKMSQPDTPEGVKDTFRQWVATPEFKAMKLKK
jgi:hypothetical protein